MFAKIINSNIEHFALIDKFARLINCKYTSKILYGLLRLEFSSYSELAKLLNASDLKEFNRSINKLRNHGIIKNVYISSHDYQAMYVFWKEEYKTSSSRPALYKLSDEWKQLLKNIEVILKHYAGENVSESGIDSRNINYVKYSDNLKIKIASAKEIERNSLGKCYECEKIITKNMLSNADYKQYGKIYICSLCHKKSDPEKILKWMKARK